MRFLQNMPVKWAIFFAGFLATPNALAQDAGLAETYLRDLPTTIDEAEQRINFTASSVTYYGDGVNLVVFVWDNRDGTRSLEGWRSNMLSYQHEDCEIATYATFEAPKHIGPEGFYRRLDADCGEEQELVTQQWIVEANDLFISVLAITHSATDAARHGRFVQDHLFGPIALKFFNLDQAQ